MLHMKRSRLASAATIVAAVGLVPASASAQIVELGVPKTALVAPACPKGVTSANCTIILTQVTALETTTDAAANPTAITQPGYIVAFTVGLSSLSSNRTTRKTDLHYLDGAYGGTTRVAVTVLQPSGASKLHKWTVAAEGPVVHVQPYLGEVVQFPLATALPVKAGDVVALTTPTWAPVLSIDLSTAQFGYRQSRSSGCATPPAVTQAQLAIGASATYSCSYPGTRVEYSATEVTTPAIPKDYVHAPDVTGKAAADVGLAGVNVRAAP
jgi:hypothetical protein